MVYNTIGFQESASPLMEGIQDLHNHVFFYLVLVLVFVIAIFYQILMDFLILPYFFFFFTKTSSTYFPGKSLAEEVLLLRAPTVRFLNPIRHHALIEIIWTLIPSLILVLIAIPSLALLYVMDEVIDPAITLKAVGHQWYWSYEYSDYYAEAGKSLSFDSYMVDESELTLGDKRLLKVDNPVVLPVDTHIRVLVSSIDVLHAWTVPALGVKVDAVPGRLNQLNVFIKREGVFYGQCSELCGVNHGFMPIELRAVDLREYSNWVFENLNINIFN